MSLPQHSTPRHTLFVPGADPSAGHVVIEGDEARHAARVKRIKPGEAVRVMDGAGLVITGEAAETGRSFVIKVLAAERVERPSPVIEIVSATPKGPRAGAMIDLLSQTGACRWTPLETAFGVESVSPSRRERLERVAVEALKQCGRPWLLEIGEELGVANACAGDAGTELVLADAGGTPYTPEHGSRQIRVLVGPEGGWRDDERQRALDAGARACAFGPHVMRIEAAATAAALIVRDACRRRWDLERPDAAQDGIG